MNAKTRTTERLRKLLWMTFGFISFVGGFFFLETLRPSPDFRQVSRLGLCVFAASCLTLAVFARFAWIWVPEAGSRGRTWALAISVLELILPLLPLAISLKAMLRFESSLWPLSILGLLGICAYARPYSVPWPRARRFSNISFQGDGTIAFLNKNLWIPALLLGDLFLHWSTDLFSALRVPNVLLDSPLQFGIVLIISVILHELGHTVFGMRVGMVPCGVAVGPLQWLKIGNHWSFRLNLRSGFFLGGQVWLAPRSMKFDRWGNLAMVAGGPIVTLILGVLGTWTAYSLRTASPLQVHTLLASFGTLNLLLLLVNLLPYRLGQYITDGARMIQCFTEGNWTEYQKLVNAAGATLMTPLRPRDLDISLLERTSQQIDTGLEGLQLRLLKYFYFLDKNQTFEASTALDEAEEIFMQFTFADSSELALYFVFGNAYLHRDADRARYWWAQANVKSTRNRDAEFWLAKCAMNWIDGNRYEAWEDWRQLSSFVKELPPCGSREFNRHCCELLQIALEEPRTDRCTLNEMQSAAR